MYLCLGTTSTQAVFRKIGGHEGNLRLQKYAFLAGEERTTTVATEAGVKLKLDISKVYYSPRSAPERLRIASFIQEYVTRSVPDRLLE
jgi:tRNA (guanine37-N1)-methyltransferase